MIQHTFTDQGTSQQILLGDSDSLTFSYQLSNNFDGVLKLLRTKNGGLSFDVIQQFTAGTGIQSITPGAGLYNFAVEYGNGLMVLTGSATITLDSADTTNAVSPSTFVTLAAQPASGSVAISGTQNADKITLQISLAQARLNVVRSASGSFASIHLFDVIHADLAYIACKQSYIAFVEGPLLTGGAGNADFTIGVATASIPSPEDGILDYHSQNIGTACHQVNVAGSSNGQKLTTGIDVNSTDSSASIYLNFAGTAASILANDYLDVTGTVTVVLQQV